MIVNQGFFDVAINFLLHSQLMYVLIDNENQYQLKIVVKGLLSMITVTNRFLVKKGFAHKMAPLFTSDTTLLNWEGFNKVEVNVCSEQEEHDEMNVMMFWDTVEQFQAWRESDDFKNLHRRERIGNKGNGDSSPIITNRVVISEITATLVK